MPSGVPASAFPVKFEKDAVFLRRPGLKVFPYCSKNILIGATTGQLEADATDTDLDSGSDLEQTQAYRSNRSFLESSTVQPIGLKAREHQVGKGTEPESQLIGGHCVSAGAI